MDGKWGANDVAEGVDYPQTSIRFRTRNMAFRLTIFTVVVRAMGCVTHVPGGEPWSYPLVDRQMQTVDQDGGQFSIRALAELRAGYATASNDVGAEAYITWIEDM